MSITQTGQTFTPRSNGLITVGGVRALTGCGYDEIFTRVDGSAAANKALRTVLFGVSQKGAVYPQLFACRSTTCEGAAGAAHATVDPAAVTFLGDGEALIDAVEREAVDELLVPLSRQG